LVLVEAGAAGITGLGFTYASRSTALLIQEKLRPLVLGSDALDVQGTWEDMVRAVRNLGRPGISSMAISAADIALWDLKARILQLPLVKLLGQVHATIPAYGSGGFTSYSPARLQEQLAGWVEAGLRSVKMKIGREPERDAERVQAARRAIGLEAELFVDANGAYSRKQALEQADTFAQHGVRWFEEPVISEDLAGLRFLRDRMPASIVVAAGEYGYDAAYFRRMLEAGAVDVMQADATRCGGITGFMQAATLCGAFLTQLSAHTAPSIHQHTCCATGRALNVEYFYDHYRIEQMLFEGAAMPQGGMFKPDLGRWGLGLELRRSDAQKYEVAGWGVVVE
jgi:L-alanine-DL-glutamate epimerase-like enolase superfamily enzyme